MFWKEEIVIFIYNNYIDGFSVEEIWFKLRLFGFDEISFEEINEIIDDVNSVII